MIGGSVERSRSLFLLLFRYVLIITITDYNGVASRSLSREEKKRRRGEIEEKMKEGKEKKRRNERRRRE